MLIDTPTCANDDAKGSARNAARTKERNFMGVVLMFNQAQIKKVAQKN